ncbi:hypothetical protein [Halobellus ordinarius]|uniref:hypothetical protein n=1 Tax=Halobellus ordinarius TaxID=3075120 RepID=UPI0028805A1B|nr:hypothetical protein [Halobellus sp. ZY16]
MTNEEIEELRTKLREQREEIRDYLAGENVDVSGWKTPTLEESEPDRETADSD